MSVTDEELGEWRHLAMNLQDPELRAAVVLNEQAFAKGFVRVIDELRAERAQARVFRGAIGRVLDLGAEVLRGAIR